MEQRKPYNLKLIISIYNIFQVAASIYIVYGVCAYFNRPIVSCNKINEFIFYLLSQ